MIKTLVLLCLSALCLCEAFQKVSRYKPCNGFGKSITQICNTKQINKSNSRLYLDFFGLGPTEVIVIVVVGTLLFGPRKVKDQLRDSGMKSDLLNDDPDTLRVKRIQEMKEYAATCRKERAWARLTEEIDSENPLVMKKLEEYENIKK